MAQCLVFIENSPPVFFAGITSLQNLKDTVAAYTALPVAALQLTFKSNSSLILIGDENTFTYLASHSASSNTFLEVVLGIKPMEEKGQLLTYQIFNLTQSSYNSSTHLRAHIKRVIRQGSATRRPTNDSSLRDVLKRG